LADSLQWEDLEAWFQTDDLADSFQLSEAPPELQMQENQEESERDPEDERKALIELHREEMTPRQLTIIQRLVEGRGYDAIMQEVDIKKSTLLRELAIITEILSLPVEDEATVEA
jgi:DNA-binding CsgD family transcriptional regulator